MREPLLLATILESSIEFLHWPFAKPLRLSSGTIHEITEARVSVTVRVGRREATGHGAIYLSDMWAWPHPILTHAQRDEALRQECRRIAQKLWTLCGAEAAHPLELGLRLHQAICHEQSNSFDSMPVLARALCASPFDAAIHDATGQGLQMSAFDFYEEPMPIPSADKFFSSETACSAIRSLIEKPVRSLPAWLVVGAFDSLADEVAPQVRKNGYKCFKLKLMGWDNEMDVKRTVEVFRFVRELGIEHPRLSVDTNEANPDAASVLDYLQRLQRADEDAFEAVEYLEQPTSRDILSHAFDWHDVTRLKPVLLDEGLTHLELLGDTLAQGWSGLCLKTCKGHSFILVAAAWARRHGLLLSLQDLTNPGFAAIHAMMLAAHIPMCNGVELNSPQYTPAANAEWLPRLNTLFNPRNGRHHLATPHVAGLGSTL